MESRQYEIECGRCGSTRPDLVTEVEARGITDETAPLYRHCDRCGQTTGWIRAKSGPALAAEATVLLAPTKNL